MNTTTKYVGYIARVSSQPSVYGSDDGKDGQAIAVRLARIIERAFPGLEASVTSEDVELGKGVRAPDGDFDETCGIISDWIAQNWFAALMAPISDWSMKPGDQQTKRKLRQFMSDPHYSEIPKELRISPDFNAPMHLEYDRMTREQAIARLEEIWPGRTYAATEANWKHRYSDGNIYETYETNVSILPGFGNIPCSTGRGDTFEEAIEALRKLEVAK